MSQAPDNPTTTQPPAKRTRRIKWWHVYGILLLASFLSQIGEGRLPALPGGMQEVELTTQRRGGPVQPPPATNPDIRPPTPPTVTLRYRDEGPPTGPPVLLLHGSPGSSNDFTRTQNALVGELAEQGYRVIAPDLPGFGASTPYAPDYSNRAHARYAIELLEALDIDSAHLVGFSMGGGVAIQLFDLEPDRVRSLTMLAAIGVQEAEGSGDYHFEHLKYGVGYLLLVGGVELVPHFGLLGDRSFRHAFLRNFWDTDQRPNRQILQRFDKPMLILHGEGDPLAPVRVAYEHHEVVQQSELIVYAKDDFKNSFENHAMVFTENGNSLVLDALLPFLDKHRDPATPAARSTIDYGEGQASSTLRLPGDLELKRSMSPWTKIAVIMLGTFILEDPTSIAVGLFIKAGQIDPFVGGFAVLFGIFLGDFGLYLLGSVIGRRALRWKPVAAWAPTRQIDKLGAWFDDKGWKAMLASRFIPGSRLPLYIAAGVTGSRPGRFMLWTLMAVCIWVPVILFTVILLGNAAQSPFQALLDFGGWPAFVVVVLLIMVMVNVLVSLFSKAGRRKLAVRVQKQARYEYWPAYKFYLLLAPYWLYLCFKYRSTTIWTLANPCMPDGGVVGESKSDILSRIDDPAVLKHHRIPASDDPADRLHRLRTLLQRPGWSYPVILKPDAAQRGAAVRLIRSEAAAAAYFELNTADVQAQQYHPGPQECGIFYLRYPDQPTGRIFSITDKVFPVLVGDGQSDLEELIWRHPRFRFQHDVFHIRFADELDRVLAKGETLRLAEAGNHCQGTLFRDGSQLITPELEARIDAICQKLEGYYFGRLDVRYKDAESLKRGEDLAVIEFNGVTSESTNIYDPTWKIAQAQRVLREQWKHCFAVGQLVSKETSRKPKSGIRLLLDVIRYYLGRHVSTFSD